MNETVGSCFIGRILGFLHVSDEAESLPWQRLDQALPLPGIADCSPDDVQARRQRCIRHAPPLPDRVDQVVLADDALPVADQVIEEVEDLWRNGDHLHPATQFAPVGVEYIVLEVIAQDANPLDNHRLRLDYSEYAADEENVRYPGVTLWGPAHGGANEAALAMLAEIGSVDEDSRNSSPR